MATRSPLDPRLQAALDAGACIVTATRRLARWIGAQHDHSQAGRGRGAWRPADVLPWDAWLRRSWLHLRDRADSPICTRLLSGGQTRLLWRTVLDDLPALRGAVLPGDAAAACHRSWSIARAYELTPAQIAGEGGEDARQFAAAAAAFAERCRDAGWIDAAGLAGQLAAAATDSPIAPAGTDIVFVGFDPLTRSQQRMLERLRGGGIEVLELPTAVTPQTALRTVVACEDPDDELWRVAAWARSRLEQDPGAQLGVILAEPEATTERLAAVLEDVLTPGRLASPSLPDAGLWNLYLDRALTDWPLADTALRLLEFSWRPVPIGDVGRLLHSPSLAGPGPELDARARLDAWLRREGFFELSLPMLLDVLRQPVRRARPECPRLLATLEAAAVALEEMPRRQRPDAWALAFGHLLRVLGWPGPDCDSEAFQTVQRWQQTLVELGSLELLLGSTDAAGALAELARLARDVRFQPENDTAAVHVTGLIDAGGVGFDACWVAGLHDGVLPRPLSPDPLIPAGLQRRLGLPRSDAELERRWGRRIVQRIGACAGDVSFSWPQRQEDRELRPSPLVAAFEEPIDPAPLPERYVARLHASSRLVSVDDFQLAPAGADAGGGTDLLRQQSDCPFRAQAVYRLGADPLEAPQAGIDRRTSGSLAHRALESLWGRWGDQAGLPDGPQARAETTTTLEGLIRRLPPGVRLGRRALLQIERARLTGLIAELLDRDRARPPFTVLERESDRHFQLGPLNLQLRIDRIDRSGDGTLLVIDYKSGTTRPGAWLNERPEAPQLPAYALALGSEVVAIAVASLKAGEVGYVGLGGDGEFGPGIEPVGRQRTAAERAGDWPGLVRLWDTWLTALARAYQSGVATVDPRGPEACRYCHLTTLCRRHELAGEATS